MVVFLVACTQSVIFEQTRNIARQGWHKDSTMVFEPVINDTSQIMNLGFTMEHSADYPYSNLWLFIDVESPGGELQTDTMEFFLAEPDGQWIGRGSNRSRTLHWLYKGHVKLAHPGEYCFTIEQGMRRDRLDGIQSLSMWIEKASPEATQQ